MKKFLLCLFPIFAIATLALFVWRELVWQRELTFKKLAMKRIK